MKNNISIGYMMFCRFDSKVIMFSEKITILKNYYFLLHYTNYSESDYMCATSSNMA
jgi:hypothetical protein